MYPPTRTLQNFNRRPQDTTGTERNPRPTYFFIILLRDLESVIIRLRDSGVIGELWVDGSFVTSKLNPADMDFILVCDALQYDHSPEMRKICDSLSDPVNGWPPSSCDTNVAYRDPPENPSNFHDVLRYWERRFGTAPTKGLPKGIVVVRLGEAEQ